MSIRFQFKLDGIGQQCVAFGGFGFGQPVDAGGQIVKCKQTCCFYGCTRLDTIFTKCGIQAAIIQQLFQLELHAAQLCLILGVLLCDVQVILGILQFVGQSQLQGGCTALFNLYCVLENRVFPAVNLNHIARRAAVECSICRCTFQYAVGVIHMGIIFHIKFVQAGKLCDPAIVPPLQFNAVAGNIFPIAFDVRCCGALQFQVDGRRQFLVRNIRRAVLLYPLLRNH